MFERDFINDLSKRIIPVLPNEAELEVTKLIFSDYHNSSIGISAFSGVIITNGERVA
jgi:hypothetical protein